MCFFVVWATKLKVSLKEAKVLPLQRNVHSKRCALFGHMRKSKPVQVPAPSQNDITRALSGDCDAKKRVRTQQQRFQKRVEEIARWEAEHKGSEPLLFDAKKLLAEKTAAFEEKTLLEQAAAAKAAEALAKAQLYFEEQKSARCSRVRAQLLRGHPRYLQCRLWRSRGIGPVGFVMMIIMRFICSCRNKKKPIRPQ